MNAKRFKERVLGLFDKYKDEPIVSVRKFNNDIYLKYGFIPTSDLSREIINYQVKKYGHQLTENGLKIFKPTHSQCVSTRKRREDKGRRSTQKWRLQSLEDRADKRIKNKSRKKKV